MQPHPSLARILQIAIAISVVSVLGTGCVFSAGDGSEPSIPATAFPSIEAETPTLFIPTQEEILPTATGTGLEVDTEVPTETPSSTSTPVTEIPPTPSPTPTPAQIQSLGAGKYDDTDPNIAYDPYWRALRNSSTVQSYKGTIHASTGTGNTASFRFTGQGFLLGYQRGRSFGTVTVLIDDQSYSFHEEDFSLVWRSPQLSPGDHFVQIIHQSGETINLDYVEILE